MNRFQPARAVPAEATTVSPSSAGSVRLKAFAPLLIDVVVPTVLYFVLNACGLRPVYALTAAGLATGLTAAVASLRRRRLDGVGLLVVIEIVVSIVLLLVSQNPRVVSLKPSFYTFIAAVYLFSTCFYGRPTVYEAATPLATHGDPARLRAYREAWDVSAPFRSRERLINAVFATALLLEAVLRVIIVLALPAGAVGRALVVGQLPGVALIVGALLFARSQVPALTRVVDDLQARHAEATGRPLSLDHQ